MEELPKVIIYTDGSYSRQDLNGGWSAYLICGEHKLVVGGYGIGTSNNRMEIYAVLHALSVLHVKCDVTIYSDSQYVVKGIKWWIYQWVRNGWKTGEGTPVKNKDLWEQIYTLTNYHKVNIHWVKAHRNNIGNNFVDHIAQTLRKNQSTTDIVYNERIPLK